MLIHMAVKQGAIGSPTYEGRTRPSGPRQWSEKVRAVAAAHSTLGRFLAAGGVSYLVNQAALVLLYDFALAGLPRRAATPFGHLNSGLLVASVLAVEISILVRFMINDRSQRVGGRRPRGSPGATGRERAWWPGA